MAGSRVAGGHHAVTRSALDAVRRWAESGAQGRRLYGGTRGWLSARDVVGRVGEPLMSPGCVRLVQGLRGTRNVVAVPPA
jgi:hypothetical protein